MRNLEDYNYHNDSRVRAGEKRSPFQDINEQAKTANVLLEVCPTCDGAGKHINPSIDAGGISQQDFREGYMAGAYDVVCCECTGLRVIWELDEVATDKEIVKRFHAMQREQAEFEAVSRAERMMGA